MLHDSPAFSGFSVNDLDKAEEFYSKTLGVEVARNEMGVQLKIAGSKPIFVYGKPDHTPASFTVLNFPVPDIDKAVDELTAKGVSMEKYDDLGNGAVPDDKGILRGLAANMGPDIAWFKDPAGNILSVLQDR